MATLREYFETDFNSVLTASHQLAVQRAADEIVFVDQLNRAQQAPPLQKGKHRLARQRTKDAVKVKS